ncbi:MAG: DCC1-like thiol-disulfide oxidoreductase family protein [Methylacidiphilales bacterium]|nr:DCC1-like thiol-disulfide oxidoreductase family protein [Candidatus Methylacidiphilales bacterium]MDW8349963.1 DCC1-like thiol-disulfide oxidoreductase family protein [Verrucomicrobiae bacterium]
MALGSIIIYYDGLCAFCNAWVRRLIRWDTRGQFYFATQQGALFQKLLQAHPELMDVNSIVIHDQRSSRDNLYIKSEAVLFAFSLLDYPYRFLALLRYLPRRLRDRGYDLFARHRYRLFGRYDICPAPPPHQRSRFLD